MNAPKKTEKMNLLDKSSARGVWSDIPRVPLLLSKYTYIYFHPMIFINLDVGAGF
jgi:hypothetical protein